MTLLEFRCMCGRYHIDISIALENENVRKALANKDNDEVERVLLEEF